MMRNEQMERELTNRFIRAVMDNIFLDIDRTLGGLVMDSTSKVENHAKAHIHENVEIMKNMINEYIDSKVDIYSKFIDNIKE